MGWNLFEPFRRGETISYVGNVIEGRGWNGVFQLEGSRVYEFCDWWNLGQISDGMIAHVQRKVGDFAERDGLNRFNFWLADVWYVIQRMFREPL